MSAVASETYTSTSAPIQYAAVRAFEPNRQIDDYLRRCRHVLRMLGPELARRLREAGAAVHAPDGAFYLFPDFGPLRDRLESRGIRDSATMCDRLLEETGVAILPGIDFGRPADELTARLSYVNFDGGQAIAALEGSAEAEGPVPGFIETHCAETLEAVDRICAWVRG